MAILLSISAFSFSVSAAGKDANVEKYIQGSNSFGLKIFQNLAKTKQNVLYSPTSMNAALSMVGHFATPKSQEALLKAMDFKGLSIEEYNEAMKKVAVSFQGGKTSEYGVNSANSIWVDKDYTMERSFKTQQFESLYSAIPNNEHFFSSTSAADAMNAWVKKATGERIPQLVTAEEVAPLDWIAINAVYFEGKWFKKFGTKFKAPFTKANGTAGQAQYLEASPGSGVSMVEATDYTLFELGYGKAERNQAVDHKGSMIIVQPKDPKALATLVQSMTVEKFNGLLKSLAEQKELGNGSYVAVNIPAFELDFNTDMAPVKDALVAAGADEFFKAFDMSSLNENFTAVNNNKIKLIKQKANITVANEGTIAAAASAVGGGIESMGPRSVYVDSAFMYFIVDKATNAILFVGTLTDTDSVKVPKMK